MIVNSSSLGQYVRETCIYATRLIQQLTSGVIVNPFGHRKTILTRICNTHVNSLNPPKFFQTLFVPQVAKST